MSKETVGKIKAFGIDKTFYAYAIDGYCLAVCFGGTAYAHKFERWKDFDELIAPMELFNETQCIDYCKKNGWLNYDYYNDELIDYNSELKIIIKLSKSIGHSV